MSFVTNNNSRRTKRARVHGTAIAQTKLGGNDLTVKSFATHPDVTTAGRKSNLTVTTIGSENSKGLTIIGGQAGQDFNNPNNPNNKTIPGERGGTVDKDDGTPANDIADPEFPVTFSGPGYMSFKSELKIPHIRGDTYIHGDLKVSGTVTSSSAPILGFGLYAPTIMDALGNELDGVTMTETYVSEVTGVHYFQTRIQWTGKTLIDNSQAMILSGMPVTTYPEGASVIVQPLQGLYTVNVGGNIYAKISTATNDYLDLYEYSTTSGAAAVPVLGSEFGSTGEVVISGWIEA